MLLGFFFCREGVLVKVLIGAVEDVVVVVVVIEGRTDLKDWMRGVRRRKSGEGVGR